MCCAYEHTHYHSICVNLHACIGSETLARIWMDMRQRGRATRSVVGIMKQRGRATRSVAEYVYLRGRATRSVAGYMNKHASFHSIIALHIVSSFVV